MFIKQLSVFIENSAGKIFDAASVLSGAGVNIRSLCLAETADFGVLRLIVDKPAEAAEALRNSGFAVGITEVIAVEVEDHVGGFAGVAKIMAEAGLNVEYMYAFVEKNNGNAVLIFRFDDIQSAAEILLKKGLRILREKDALAL